MKYFIFLILILVLLSGCDNRQRIVYAGEPCEEITDLSIFEYNRNNASDKIRSEIAWAKYSNENNLKGYCKDGKRIGNVI